MYLYVFLLGLITGTESLLQHQSSTDLVSDSEGEGGTNIAGSKSKKSERGPKRSG